jgi:hypothetical protein
VNAAVPFGSVAVQTAAPVATVPPLAVVLRAFWRVPEINWVQLFAITVNEGLGMTYGAEL